MALSTKQVKAAQLLARGLADNHVYPKVGVSEATFYRWKKLKTFQECLTIFQRAELEKSEAVAAAAGHDDLNQSRKDEQYIAEKQRELVKELCELNIDLVKRIRKEGITQLPPRMLGSFSKALVDAINSLREGNDRLSGLEALLDDIDKIEKTVQERALQVASSEQSKAA